MDIHVPPNDIDAEQSVLASLLYDAPLIPQISGVITADDFYRPDYAEIYTAFVSMYNAGTPIDVITLKNELHQRGTLDAIGGAAGITELAASYYTSANAKHHAMEVKRLSESRRIYKTLVSLVNKPDDITVDDLKAVTQAAEENQYIRTYAEKSLKSLDDFKKNLRVKKQRVKTGFTTFDGITGGFRIPSVVMVGAYPSVGKTAFALNIAAAQKKPVVFFSLEMSCEMIYERRASAALNINYNLFTSQRLSEAQYRDVEAYTDQLKQSGFHVFDDMYFIEQQASIISSIKPALVVVDYVQKVKTRQRVENRRTEIDAISGLYKQIAKNNNCVILLLSQLSRPDKQVKNPKPTMASLKESGALEADGDYIGILHRPYVLHKDDPLKTKPEDGYILIDKNKFGNTGHIDLYFEGCYQRFREVDKTALYNEAMPLEVDDSPFE